ncbi:hypothetical protein TSUD_356120 [Trifolium subterraneum]|uniref:Uncharacterized protein n=1 Tax=Trifolium subterraneum TaxID=3900 RepID=A0A2Z6MHA0_TRISU|nr:hypothetical protein TSUD_356120 [Trifolium subterraneum]
MEVRESANWWSDCPAAFVEGVRVLGNVMFRWLREVVRCLTKTGLWRMGKTLSSGKKRGRAWAEEEF